MFNSKRFPVLHTSVSTDVRKAHEPTASRRTFRVVIKVQEFAQSTLPSGESNPAMPFYMLKYFKAFSVSLSYVHELGFSIYLFDLEIYHLNICILYPR